MSNAEREAPYKHAPAMTGQTASMSQWMIVRHNDRECLFGFAERHSRTGGLSWTLSTPVVRLDEEEGRAITASGRRYLLGTRIGTGQLNEEGRLAKNLLLLGIDGVDLGPCDLTWLVACKWARHLQLPAPDRTDCKAVMEFLEACESRYVLERVDRRFCESHHLQW